MHTATWVLAWEVGIHDKAVHTEGRVCSRRRPHSLARHALPGRKQNHRSACLPPPPTPRQNSVPQRKSLTECRRYKTFKKKKKRKLVLSSEPNQTVGGTDIYLGRVRALPRGDAVSKAGRGTANPSTATSWTWIQLVVRTRCGSYQAEGQGKSNLTIQIWVTRTRGSPDGESGGSKACASKEPPFLTGVGAPSPPHRGTQPCADTTLKTEPLQPGTHETVLLLLACQARQAPVREWRRGRIRRRLGGSAPCRMPPRRAWRVRATSYLRSILSIFWCDFCLFMDHYFGYWHVGVLLFGLFNCLSQRLSPGNHRRAKTKRRWDMHEQ